MSTRPSKRLEIHRLSLTFVNRHTCNGNFKGKFGGSIIHDFLLHRRLCVQMRKEEQEDASQNRCLSVEQKRWKFRRLDVTRSMQILVRFKARPLNWDEHSETPSDPLVSWKNQEAIQVSCYGYKWCQRNRIHGPPVARRHQPENPQLIIVCNGDCRIRDVFFAAPSQK